MCIIYMYDIFMYHICMYVCVCINFLIINTNKSDTLVFINCGYYLIINSLKRELIILLKIILTEQIIIF